MKIGLIARADNTGLGIQSKEFFDHIPCKVLIIDSQDMMPSLHLLKPDYSRYSNFIVHKIKPGPSGLRIPESIIDQFLRDIDILFCMETPYDHRIFDICRQRGIKSILQFNYEFLDYPSLLPMPDLFAAPSRWHYEDVPGNKVFLPVPVNTKKFKPLERRNTFVHNVGRPAFKDRNGTLVLMDSLKHIRNKVDIEVHSQQPVPFAITHNNVTVKTEFTNKENYWENYQGGVLVLPRKYGGLSLPINEALACEMPVITTDISPNSLWLPKEWLVESDYEGEFFAKKKIRYYRAKSVKLAEKIDQFCDPDFFDEAVCKAKQLKKEISWDNLLPLYHKTFREILA